jgi:hypothetical protein
MARLSQTDRNVVLARTDNKVSRQQQNGQIGKEAMIAGVQPDLYMI